VHVLHFFPTLHFPSHSSHLFVTHTLFSLFYFHSAPYFISSLTLQFPSPSSQLFVPTIYLLCSIVTVLLISILPSHYTFPIQIQFPTPSSQQFLIHILSTLFSCHNAPYFNSSFKLHFPSQFRKLYVPTLFFAMFHCHSAPYFTFSLTLHIPSPSSQLFVPTFIYSVTLLQCALFHFFRNTTLYLSIQSAVCIHNLFAVFYFYSAP
jgi:hypothetical protein